MSRKPAVSLLMAGLFCILVALQQPAKPAQEQKLPIISVERIATAPVLPCIGEPVKLRVVIRNQSVPQQQQQLVAVKISAKIINLYPPLATPQLVISKTLPEVAPGEEKRVELGTWQPVSSGLYIFKVWITAAVLGEPERQYKTEAALRFAVTEHKVQFAWYLYHPANNGKFLRYPTMHLTIKREEVEDWLFDGRLPLSWKGGACYWSRKDCHPNPSIEGQAKCWANIDIGVSGIAVDEWGYDESAPKLVEVIRKFKAANPKLILALWNLPQQPYLAEIRDTVDIFIPEVYLNYHGMHLGVLEANLERIIKEGLARKTLIGLGINYGSNNEKYPLATTPQELKAQFRLIKATVPDILGVAFFNYAKAPQGLPEVADELCFKYFVLPVIRISDLKLQNIAPQSFKASALLENIGNMTAYNIIIEAQVDGKCIKFAKFKNLEVGKPQHISIPLGKLPKGFHIVRLRVVQSEQLTPLNEEGLKAVAAVAIKTKPAANIKRIIVYLPAVNFNCSNVPLKFKLPQKYRLQRVVEYAADGRILKQLKAQQTEDATCVWLVNVPANKFSFFGIEVKTFDSAKEPPQYVNRKRAGKKFVFENEFYKAVVAVPEDAISELVPKPAAVNLFSSPWQLQMNAKCVFREAFVVEGLVFTELFISTETADAHIGSKYIFYHHSPLIEVKREVSPKQPFALNGQREGCGFPQHGGFAVYFTGEGCLRINRTELLDTDTYRDLYFGYLGSPPSPANHQKCGWLDFVWKKEYNAGLGIAIIERWVDSHSTAYDVTRYYDASDHIDVFYSFRYAHDEPPQQVKILKPQYSHILLLPHSFVDLAQPQSTAPIMPFYQIQRQNLKLCVVAE